MRRAISFVEVLEGKVAKRESERTKPYGLLRSGGRRKWDKMTFEVG